jgi:hypothetical protein
MPFAAPCLRGSDLSRTVALIGFRAQLAVLRFGKRC